MKTESIFASTLRSRAASTPCASSASISASSSVKLLVMPMRSETAC